MNSALHQADCPSCKCLVSRHGLYLVCLNTHNERQLNSFDMANLNHQYRNILFFHIVYIDSKHEDSAASSFTRANKKEVVLAI